MTQRPASTRCRACGATLIVQRLGRLPHYCNSTCRTRARRRWFRPVRPHMPSTAAKLIAMWRRNGYQHFHLVTRPGGSKRTPYVAWTAVMSERTPVCEDPSRCLLLKVRREPEHPRRRYTARSG